MDIYIIKIIKADEVHKNLLKEFQKKEISDSLAWNRHCFSYLMLDRILREVYKIENREIFFENNKPKLINNSKHFSISHSKEFIAIAFSDYNCGVDIEINKMRDYSKISQKMGFNSNSLDEFYLKWTEFEANYKLQERANSTHQFKFENYTITAVSTNKKESFEIYFSV